MRKWFKRLFCSHAWVTAERGTYIVKNSAGTAVGSVVLTLLTCQYCGADKLLATDVIRSTTPKPTQDKS